MFPFSTIPGSSEKSYSIYNGNQQIMGVAEPYLLSPNEACRTVSELYLIEF